MNNRIKYGIEECHYCKEPILWGQEYFKVKSIKSPRVMYFHRSCYRSSKWMVYGKLIAYGRIRKLKNPKKRNYEEECLRLCDPSRIDNTQDGSRHSKRPHDSGRHCKVSKRSHNPPGERDHNGEGLRSFDPPYTPSFHYEGGCYLSDRRRSLKGHQLIELKVWKGNIDHAQVILT